MDSASQIQSPEQTRCLHANKLMSLQGWQTLWCPICDKDSTQRSSEQEITVTRPAIEPKRNGLQELLMKNKLEQSTAKCKCPHDAKDVCIHAGTDYACSKCTENCIPF